MSAAADRERALELSQRLRALGTLTVTPFFGGSGIRLDGLQFAFLIEGVLYFKVDERGRSDYEALGAAPFTYAARNGRVTVTSYYELPDEILEDPEQLRSWAVKAHAAATAKTRPKRKSAAGKRRR